MILSSCLIPKKIDPALVMPNITSSMQHTSLAYGGHAHVLRKALTEHTRSHVLIGLAKEYEMNPFRLELVPIRNTKHAPSALCIRCERHIIYKMETEIGKTSSASSSSIEDRPLHENSDDSRGMQSVGAYTIDKEMRSLDSYFRKLYQNTSQTSTTLPHAQSNLNPLKESTNSNFVSATVPQSSTQSAVEIARRTTPKREQPNAQKSPMDRGPAILNDEEDTKFKEIEEIELDERNQKVNTSLKNVHLIRSLYESDEITHLDPKVSVDYGYSEPCMVYILVAVNIAVYIFGLATPVETPLMSMSTMPVLFGAKVNELILYGEWWRLIASMFLFSGFFHISLSSWALLGFGPVVERVYGSLAFCMIYFLGGLFGNILSFLHTDEATVGGTGPLFAVLSSWIVYLLQNRKLVGDELGDGFMLAILTSAPVIALSCLLPVDIWIHLGAVCAGFMFAAFVCPVGQVKVEAGCSLDQHRNIKRLCFSLYRSSWMKLIAAFCIFVAVYMTILNFNIPTEIQDTLENLLL